MFGRFLCRIGFHAWFQGNDGHGVARWCNRCDCKDVLKATGVIRNLRENIMPIGMHWVRVDE